MSSKGLTIWKCDRCGEEKHLVRNTQPKEWYCLRLTRPPKAEPASNNTTTRVDLCLSCAKVIEGIIAMTLEPVEVGKDVEEEPGDDEGEED